MSSLAGSAYEVADGADVLHWQGVRRTLRFGFARTQRKFRYPIIIDGCNLYHLGAMATQGFRYYGIGRVPILSESLPMPAAHHRLIDPQEL